MTGDEKWIYFQNPKRKKSWVDLAQPSTSSSRPNRFGWKTMLCVWWDQEGVIYYELLNPGETVNAHRYHQQLIKLCVKNSAWKKAALSEKTRLTWFSFTTTYHGTHQQWFKTWRHSTGKCYPIPLTYQTWHLLTITFHRWATRSLSGTSILMKTSENGLMSDLRRKMRNFFGVVYTNCLKDGKYV